MLKQVFSYLKEIKDSAKYLIDGLSVTLSHMGRRPVTVQYPYEKLIPSERYRGRIHYEFDKCIACEVCVRVCPINLPVVDWVMNKETKKNKSKEHSKNLSGSYHRDTLALTIAGCNKVVYNGFIKARI